MLQKITAALPYSIAPEHKFPLCPGKTGFYSKHEYQANRFACALMLGEKAEEYSYELQDAAARGRLDRLVEVVGRLARGDDQP